MNAHHYAIVMAGGIGSRFWPLSRNKLPKQFQDILGTGETLLQATVRRLRDLVPPGNILIVTNHQYTGLVLDNLPFLAEEQVLAEPSGRNTAPCIAYGTFRILASDEQARVIATPADHLIRDEDRFAGDLRHALEAAGRHPYLVTIGIQPTRPDTGYGYIQFHRDEASDGIYRVKTFTEKPKLDMAQAFLRSGDFLWNSGIFIASAATLRDAFAQHLPELHDPFRAAMSQLGTEAEQSAVSNIYTTIKAISMDYGVMEKAGNVYVIKSNFGWSALGTWGALYEQLDKDEHGNALSGPAMAYGAEGNLVKNTTGATVFLKGVQDLIVVQTGDALLICPRSEEQAVREIVAGLKSNRQDEYL